MRRVPRYDLPKAAPQPLRTVQLFLNTTDHEHGRELLADGDALRAWLAEVATDPGPVGTASARRARELREAIRALVRGTEVRPELEDAARRARFVVDFHHGRLVASGRGLDGALGAIVAAVYEAMRDDSWERLKACPNCGWAFWDDSRNRSARWCSMQLCGNRLKVRRYRARATPRSPRSPRAP